MLYLNLLRFLQLRRSAASTVSQIVAVKPALRLLSGLTGKCFLMPYAPYNLPLPPSVGDLTEPIIDHKKTNKKKEIMNSQHTKQHICEPHVLIHNLCLQKSCFLAYALEKNM